MVIFLGLLGFWTFVGVALGVGTSSILQVLQPGQALVAVSRSDTALRPLASMLIWALTMIAATGQSGFFAGFITWFVGLFISVRLILGTYSRLTTRYSWHSQDAPNVIYQHHYN